MSEPGSEPASPLSRRRRLKRFARAYLLPFGLDFFVLVGTASWFVYFLDFGGFGLALIAVLLRIPRFDRFPLVRLIYFLIALMYIDSVVLGLFPLWCVSIVGFMLGIFTVVAGLVMISRTASWSVRTVTWCMVPLNILSILFVGGANRTPSEEDCARARADPAFDLLADPGGLTPLRGNPRFLVPRPDQNDLLIVYRAPMGQLVEVFADRLDLVTGELTPIDLPAESIGLYHDPVRSRSISVNFGLKADPPKTINVLNSALDVTDSFEVAREAAVGWNDYNAYMFPQGEQIGIQSDLTYLFDPESGDIRIGDVQLVPRCKLVAETGFVMLGPDRFAIAGGGSPLNFLLGGSLGICSLDLAKDEVKRYRSGLLGAWDLAYAADRNELLATSFWRSKVWVVDADTLEHKRTLDIAPCVRPIAYDPERGVGYTVECFSGDFLVFDVDTGAILERHFIGRNARKIDIVEGFGPVVASGCGVFRVR